MISFAQLLSAFMSQPAKRSPRRILSEVARVLTENPGWANTAHLECISCHSQFPTEPRPIYNCGDCNNLLDVSYDSPRKLDPQKLKAVWALRRTSNDPTDRSGVWRFRELLPFCDDETQVVTMGEGNTPLLEAPGCAEYVGLSELFVKHQGWNPTGSFKDPGMSAVMTQARILGMRAVACSSTGNTSASEAAYAQRAGILPIVFIPEGQISVGKLSQSLDYGALTIQIAGDFDKAMELIMQVAPELGIYVVNSINPFRIEGQKTIVPELLEQLDWEVPDRIVVPGGNLGHAASIWKGLKELKELGFISKFPKLTIVQAKGADPLYKTVTSRDPNRLSAVHADTLATAIKIGNPISWKKAMQGVNLTGGWITEVTEQAIADAKAVIGRDGIGCEPASAVTVAGLRRIVQKGTDVPFDRTEKIVVILTGHGLKDPAYTTAYHQGTLAYRDRLLKPNFANQLLRVPADADELKRVLSKRLAA